MFNPSFSDLFIEARVEELRRAAQNTSSSSRRSATAAFATLFTRTRTRSRQS
jgi:hypothetical protein